MKTTSSLAFALRFAFALRPAFALRLAFALRSAFVLRLAFAVCLAFAPCLAAQTATQPAKPMPTPPAKPTRRAPERPAPTPTQRPPAKPTTKPEAASSSAPPTTAPLNAPAPVVLNTCDYVDPPDATALLGRDASATTAPSKGALLTCGYTSPSGDALTVSIADYGAPSIAQQFFEKTWELTKTATVEDSLGVSGFALVTTDPPPGRASITVLKSEKIVTIEASGPTTGKAQSLPALRAIIIKLLPKLQPSPAPQPPPAP
jgi:hypothetical protein